MADIIYDVRTCNVEGCDILEDVHEHVGLATNEIQRAYTVAVAAGEVYQAERNAARALADELAQRLDAHHTVEHSALVGGSCPDDCPDRAALAKWEASRDK